MSAVLKPTEVETMYERLTQLRGLSVLVSLNRADFVGAAGVFLLVFLSTFPVVMPFFAVREVALVFECRTGSQL